MFGYIVLYIILSMFIVTIVIISIIMYYHCDCSIGVDKSHYHRVATADGSASWVERGRPEAAVLLCLLLLLYHDCYYCSMIIIIIMCYHIGIHVYPEVPPILF